MSISGSGSARFREADDGRPARKTPATGEGEGAVVRWLSGLRQVCRDLVEGAGKALLHST